MDTGRSFRPALSASLLLISLYRLLNRLTLTKIRFSRVFSLLFCVLVFLNLSDSLLYEYRTKVFYCDPMASWQKPHIEKNHEFIRYVLPRGKSLDPYDQKDITLLMNHINSIRRPSLDNKVPYELIQPEDKDMWALAELLKMDLIPPDEVHLKADLFRRNK